MWLARFIVSCAMHRAWMSRCRWSLQLQDRRDPQHPWNPFVRVTICQPRRQIVFQFRNFEFGGGWHRESRKEDWTRPRIGAAWISRSRREPAWRQGVRTFMNATVVAVGFVRRG